VLLRHGVNKERALLGCSGGEGTRRRRRGLLARRSPVGTADALGVPRDGLRLGDNDAGTSKSRCLLSGVAQLLQRPRAVSALIRRGAPPRRAPGGVGVPCALRCVHAVRLRTWPSTEVERVQTLHAHTQTRALPGRVVHLLQLLLPLLPSLLRQRAPCKAPCGCPRPLVQVACVSGRAPQRHSAENTATAVDDVILLPRHQPHQVTSAK